MKTRSRGRKTADGRRKAADAISPSSSPVSRLPSPGSDPADRRVILAGPGRGEVRERASRFLAFAHPASSAREAARFVEDLKKQYHDATHVAYAWRIGAGRETAERSSDAGEPSGTAGKPIASAIGTAGVTDAVVAVVRYFGGTRLGTGGLSRAYRDAAALCLAAAGTRIRRETRSVLVRCPYERIGALRRLLRPPEVALEDESYGPTPALKLSVVPSRLTELLTALDENRFDYELED
jgi:uncharacterized YigZ family protein